MMFKFTQHTDHFVFYFLNQAGEKVSCSKWTDLQSEFLSQLAILTELRDNGLADFVDDSCIVDCFSILNLDDIDKLVLGLPDPYPYDIFIESDGVLTHNTFRFKYGFYDFCPNGTRLNAKRNGATIQIGESNYLLSESQFRICEAIDEFNTFPDSSKGSVVNLKKLDELKLLSKENGLALEHFLKNQSLYIPKRIKIDIDFRDGSLEIFPTLEIDNALGFTNTFDKLPSVRDIYPISGGNGETTRVIISEKQKEELQKIKQKRRVSDPVSIQDIVEHPELLFDEEEIDFDVFYSERVKEIGVYKPKYYPFISPYKSQWIPGIVIKDKVHGEKRVYFKSPEKLSQFIEQKEEAVKKGANIVYWENTEIPIEAAVRLIQTAKKQFENPNKPVNQEKRNENEVLIIKENAELTEFSDNKELPEHLKHNFYEIKNLVDGINLKEHQKEGISWLQSLYKENMAGGLLADDMGLGKTLQLLYFVEWHSQHCNDNKPYLIVAPVSLLENWENEYQKFFSPQLLPLCKLYGSVLLSKENTPVKNQQDAKGLQFKQIILTNYETLRMYQISLGLVDFAIIALDEAQKIKTPGTLVTNACKALKADFKIAMTGTPVENTLVDIWCIMDFAVPGLLGNAKDFNREFQKPLIDDQTDIRTLTERLRANIGVFIKRRLKSDVAKDLPTKYDNSNSRIRKVMPVLQLERYKQEIEIANNSELDGVEGRNQKLKSLWAIRDISDHPFLLESQILSFASEELIATSAKLHTTIGILADIQSKGEKAIVFADRKETQKMLQKVLYDSFSIFPSIINGDTPSSPKYAGKSELSRQQTIDVFQEKNGFNVIIMSPIAAGVGLNVTKANHIVHYTRHWNPAKEEQATDRAYRIGQLKDVFVYYPMAVFPDELVDDKGNKLKSFDEILDSLLNSKKALARNTLFPTEQAEITPDDLFGNVFGAKAESNWKPLTLNDLDRLNPDLFEAAIAALYKKQGFDVYLTPYSNDKGVDIAVLKNEENFIIQAKQSRSLVGNEAIREIYTAQKYYETAFKVPFNLLAVTNNDYSSSAEILAKSNGVRLIRRADLNRLLSDFDIAIQDINKIESQRMQRI